MGDLPFTLFDIAVVVVIALSTLMALARGFVREVLGLVSWIGAAIITWYVFDAVRPLVRQIVGGDLLADLATGGGVFLIALIVLKVLGGIVASGIQGGGLGTLDRLAGLVFGFARGVALVCIGWLVIDALFAVDRQQPQWIEGSLLLPPVEQGAAWLQDALPGRVKEEGRTAAAKAGEGAKRLGAATDALREPQPGSSDDPGYPEKQRREMDQLFKPGG